MCRAVTCNACDKTTWAGCGQHVDQVMRSVPTSRRCDCTPEDRAAAAGPGLLARLFGGR